MNTPQEPTQETGWEGWKPDWQGNPHVLQERHSPTLTVILRGVSDAGRRRIIDLRLWESLSPPQQDAALEIAHACQLLSRGIGFAQSDWEKLPGGNSTDMGSEMAQLSGLYAAWAKQCRAQHVNHESILDILVFAQSCGAQDRDRRLRRGSSKKNLINGLSVYCRLRGWPVN
ncbi:MAG: hypothetical protein ACAH80_04090 [Alphaproteobacteria bacterium]